MGETHRKSHPKKFAVKKRGLIVSGIVVKRPRTAFDEWVDETGQRDIAKTKFPEYSLSERKDTCRYYGLVVCLTL